MTNEMTGMYVAAAVVVIVLILVLGYFYYWKPHHEKCHTSADCTDKKRPVCGKDKYCIPSSS